MDKVTVIRCLHLLGLLVHIVTADVCTFPTSWSGKWFHLGFPEPLSIGATNMTGKGLCVNMSKNMFLMEESDPHLGKCHRCMVIYEKHSNVLQYKESYCEDKIESMDWLCNTIPGDAPLYTMFRKEGELVKCPFRGPFSFSYSKGDSGQICEYPASFMDTCSDSRRLQLRYQACLDVEGSEIATEEMACLATWKEGNSRYLVAMMNHSHIYTDEARYRCFVYQKTQGDENQPEYKMAQSGFATCLGLWSVNEGYKTFTMKKLDNDNEKCVFPDWMGRHHDWMSLDGATSIHLNKRGHSLRITNDTIGIGQLESHATCHKVELDNKDVSRIVAHVKSGCDSGYVCLVFHNRDQHIIEMRYGENSRDPKEACMSYYFNMHSSPQVTLVPAAGHHTRPCPFTGRYSLTGPGHSLGNFLDPFDDSEVSDFKSCTTHDRSSEVVMHTGCSDSANLHVEAVCGHRGHILNRAFTCHGKWRPEGTDNNLLVLSVSNPRSSNHRSYFMLCLLPTSQDGVLRASPTKTSTQCESAHFNITSSGPCLQALTGAISGAAKPLDAIAVITTTSVALFLATWPAF